MNDVCTTCFGTGQIDGGSDQGDVWRCEDCDGTGSISVACPHCFEGTGYEARYIPATWDEPAWEEADGSRPCEYCHGTGVFTRREAATSTASPDEEIQF